MQLGWRTLAVMVERVVPVRLMTGLVAQVVEVMTQVHWQVVTLLLADLANCPDLEHSGDHWPLKYDSE